MVVVLMVVVSYKVSVCGSEQASRSGAGAAELVAERHPAEPLGVGGLVGGDPGAAPRPSSAD
jgi:hypothetical protein